MAVKFRPPKNSGNERETNALPTFSLEFIGISPKTPPFYSILDPWCQNDHGVFYQYQYNFCKVSRSGCSLFNSMIHTCILIDWRMAKQLKSILLGSVEQFFMTWWLGKRQFMFFTAWNFFKCFDVFRINFFWLFQHFWCFHNRQECFFLRLL